MKFRDSKLSSSSSAVELNSTCIFVDDKIRLISFVCVIELNLVLSWRMVLEIVHLVIVWRILFIRWRSFEIADKSIEWRKMGGGRRSLSLNWGAM